VRGYEITMASYVMHKKYLSLHFLTPFKVQMMLALFFLFFAKRELITICCTSFPTDYVIPSVNLANFLNPLKGGKSYKQVFTKMKDHFDKIFVQEKRMGA
jgi:hypothetical protein